MVILEAEEVAMVEDLETEVVEEMAEAVEEATVVDDSYAYLTHFSSPRPWTLADKY